MILPAIWILEAAIGLLGALLVLGDAMVILARLQSRDRDTARNFQLQVLRDGLVLGGQVVNVLIGLIVGVLVGRDPDPLTSYLNGAAVLGLMLAPALLAGISFTTYRARHR